MNFHSTKSLEPNVTASRLFDGCAVIGSMVAAFMILAAVLAVGFLCRQVTGETARFILIYVPCAVGVVALWRVVRGWVK